MDFGFPYDEPYPIQVDFMEKLYDTIDRKQIGIFESPTGTGKSLSLLCGALTWLLNHPETHLEIAPDAEISHDGSHLPQVSGSDDEPDWVRAHAKQIEEKRRQSEFHERIEKRREVLEELDQHHDNKRSRLHKHEHKIDRTDDEEFLVAEYVSDDESSVETAAARIARLQSQYWAVDNENVKLSAQDELEHKDTRKILFCSRTHSQLHQLINELKKTKFAKEPNPLALISLGSRKQLCINGSVRKLKDVARMNDKCVDLQKDKSSKCPYLDDEQTMKQFSELSIATVNDIEDLVTLGKRAKCCPYYGARSALSKAEFVTLPYSMLLCETTRKSLGINVKNNIVIIDEAHNLVDTIIQLNSASVSMIDIERCLGHLSNYLSRYNKRLLGLNSVYIKQVIYILRQMKRVLEDQTIASGETLFSISEFQERLRIEHINTFKTLKYLETSQLARKLTSFVERALKQEDGDGKFVPKHSSPLYELARFVELLNNTDLDGRVIVHKENDAKCNVLRFILLNPSGYFKSIVDEARAVILAGGTMAPVNDLIAQLFTHVSPKKISLFNCGHIIPAENLFMLTMTEGPTKRHFFEFTYNKRSNFELIDELGLALLSYISIVPDGVVVFFVSFDYMDKVLDRWKRQLSPQSTSIFERLQRKKQIFTEPKNSNELEKVLKRYSDVFSQSNVQPTGTQKRNGALLFSVVGGKMSEGINFSDELGRAVIMVGIPFPNKNSAELVERMRFLDLKRLNDPSLPSGQEYYENLCMRAVNQSIGRAIRHRNDYACVILLDVRYQHERIRKKLPEWMKASMRKVETFGASIQAISSFFRQKKNG